MAYDGNEINMKFMTSEDNGTYVRHTQRTITTAIH